ncbi:MAG: hypothetical protein QXJ74_08740 [Nitrososphaera sp.]|uniref:hypothetical protein n=1 Tax=Nitrososphaera sp. TaxID=1971748 RepID=UPI00181071C1|nr:hypothetical protein [Nitrososphaera sp.]NWG38194.1 hypothetical protein [Nitrososphaera sp.]
MAGKADEISGYVCTPHGKQTASLLEAWKKDDNIVDIYFATATFSEESVPYFPNKANNYMVASFKDVKGVFSDINSHDLDRLAFMFAMNSPLFERVGDRLNYISLYFTKYSNGDPAISDVANVIARRDRVKKASLAEMQLLAQEQPRFTFPYAKNLVILEVEGSETHQTDQKYCERTRRDVARKGIMLNNLVSFSILDKLK